MWNVVTYKIKVYIVYNKYTLRDGDLEGVCVVSFGPKTDFYILCNFINKWIERIMDWHLTIREQAFGPEDHKWSIN